MLNLLDAALDCWARNNTILLNLLQSVPPPHLTLRASPDGPTIAGMFHHLHHERMISLLEEAPRFAGDVPSVEWNPNADPDYIHALLTDSAARVAAAIRSHLEQEQQLERSFTHPLHLLQLLMFHDAYHHGQIKLTLKLAGHPIPDETAGELTWDVWRRR